MGPVGLAGTMQTPPENNNKSPLSAAGWITLAVLLGFFFVSLWYAVRVWRAMAGVQMKGFGPFRPSWC